MQRLTFNCLFPLTIALLAITAGCKTRTNDLSQLKIDSGTYISEQSKNRVPAVLWLGNCTGTAISHNTLIYAAHCVDGSPQGGSQNGQVSSRVCIKKNLANPDNKAEGACSTKLFVHPRYGNGNYRYDVAVGIFPDNTFKNYFPLQTTQPQPRDKVIMVGFSSENMTSDGIGAKRWGYNTVRRFGADAAIVSNYGNSASNVAVSPGDSGGPLFKDCRVVGVASRMSGGGTKTSLHTNLTINENQSWLRGLVDSEGAKMCGLNNTDQSHCLNSQLGAWDTALQNSNQTEEFPCAPSSGSNPAPDQQKISVLVANSSDAGVEIYVGTKDPAAEQAAICIGKDVCSGPEVALAFHSTKNDIKTFGPTIWPAQSGQDLTILIKDRQGNVIGSRSLRLRKK